MLINRFSTFFYKLAPSAFACKKVKNYTLTATGYEVLTKIMSTPKIGSDVWKQNMQIPPKPEKIFPPAENTFKP